MSFKTKPGVELRVSYPVSSVSQTTQHPLSYGFHFPHVHKYPHTTLKHALSTECWAWLLPGYVFVNISKPKEQIPCTDCKTRVTTRTGYSERLWSTSAILMGQNTLIHVAAPIRFLDLFHTPKEFLPVKINSWPFNSSWCLNTWNVLQENPSLPSLSLQALGWQRVRPPAAHADLWGSRAPERSWAPHFSCFPWISTFHHSYFL